MAIIYAPNTQYTGISAGVPFAGGQAICNDQNRLAWFSAHGYRVEEEHPASEVTQQSKGGTPPILGRAKVSK